MSKPNWHYWRTSGLLLALAATLVLVAVQIHAVMERSVEEAVAPIAKPMVELLTWELTAIIILACVTVATEAIDGVVQQCTDLFEPFRETFGVVWEVLRDTM